MREEPEHRPPEPEGAPPEGAERAAAAPHTEEEHLSAIRRARQARVAKVLVALSIVVVLIIFVIANSQPVKVNFVFLTRHPRLIWVMFACAVLGGLAGYLIGKPGRQVRVPRHGRSQDQPKPR